MYRQTDSALNLQKLYGMNTPYYAQHLGCGDFFMCSEYMVAHIL
jgi:hypothetical protein